MRSRPISGAWLAALLALGGAPAAADVVSAKPDAVAVTIYRDQPRTAEQLRGDAESGDDTTGLAMVTETRSVDLPAGETRIRFEGVSDAIIPASAKLEGLQGGEVERDFDYNLLDPASLIAKSVGGRVTVRRTDPKTGKTTEEPAVLRSGPDGVTAETSRGIEALGCGDGPSAVVFDHLPEGLAATPTLSATANVAKPGRYALKLSYLTVSVDWSADYVAHVAPDGKTLDLTGWLTLSNRSGMSFANAPTAVVAGKLARVAADLPDVQPAQRSAQCWTMGTTSDWTSSRPYAFTPSDMPAPAYNCGAITCVDEVVVVAEKREERIEKVPVAITVFTTNLGDYKLYALAEPITLAGHETKQIRFLHQARVRFEKIYGYGVGNAYDTQQWNDQPAATLVVLELKNKTAAGLGLSLPAGVISFRQPQIGAAGDELYVGEGSVGDMPVGAPFEIATIESRQVTVTRRLVSDETSGAGDDRRERLELAFTVTNAEPTPVIFELRQDPGQEGFKIVRESARHALKNGADVWRLKLPANGTAKLSYAYEVSAD